MMLTRMSIAVVFPFLTLALLVGCAKDDKNVAQAKPTGSKEGKPTDKKSSTVPDKPAAKEKDKVAEKKKDDHSGWWCAEHGIPEEECSMCLPEAKLKVMFKDQGDWCKEHDRAKSQCFKCDPKLKEAFAAKYRAKYGKEPPPIEEDEEKPKDDKKKDPAK